MVHTGDNRAFLRFLAYIQLVAALVIAGLIDAFLFVFMLDMTAHYIAVTHGGMLALLVCENWVLTRDLAHGTADRCLMLQLMDDRHMLQQEVDWLRHHHHRSSKTAH